MFDEIWEAQTVSDLILKNWLVGQIVIHDLAGFAEQAIPVLYHVPTAGEEGLETTFRAVVRDLGLTLGQFDVVETWQTNAVFRGTMYRAGLFVIVPYRTVWLSGHSR